MTRSLNLRAAFVSILIFAAFIVAWHLATRGTGAIAQMDPEYAKLMGATRRKANRRCRGRSMSEPSFGSTCAGRSTTTGRTTKGLGIQLASSIARVTGGYLLAVLSRSRSAF